MHLMIPSFSPVGSEDLCYLLCQVRSIFLSMLSSCVCREKLRDHNQFFSVEQEYYDENYYQTLHNICRELIPKDNEIRKRPRGVV